MDARSEESEEKGVTLMKVAEGNGHDQIAGWVTAIVVRSQYRQRNRHSVSGVRAVGQFRVARDSGPQGGR